MPWPALRIGNQTAFSAAYPTAPFDFALENNFDAFEWFNDKRHGWGWAQEDSDAHDRARIREIGQSRKIAYSVHARCQADANSPADREEIFRSIDFARDIGAGLVNIYYSDSQGPEGFAESLTAVYERAKAAGVRLSVENTVFVGPDVFNRLFTVLQKRLGEVPGDLGMCFDMGHANLCAASRNNYVGFLEKLESFVPVIHLHVHENWGDGDSHLPLFTGPAGQDDSGVRTMLRLLKERGFDGAVIMEQWPNPPEQLLGARNRLKQLIVDTH